MDTVVDDHLLLRILLDGEPEGLRRGGARLYTTGLWYHRLCRAVARDQVTGAMTRRLRGVNPATASATVRAVVRLPDHVGLVSLRELSWPMAELLVAGPALDLLSLEALAAATVLGAELCLAPDDDNRPLRQAATARSLPVRLVAP